MAAQENKQSWSYPAILTLKPREEISVLFPDLDVATSGINEEDALFSARELLRCVLHGLQADGQPFPAPTAWKALPVGPDEKAVLVTTDIEPVLEPMSPEECREHFSRMIGMEVYCDEPNRVVPEEDLPKYEGKTWAEVRKEMFTPEELIDPSTGTELHPSYHGKDCLGNGEHPGIECCCDECDHFISCTGWAPGKIWDESEQRYI